MMNEVKKPTIRNATILPNGRINGQVFNDSRFNNGEWIITTPIQKAKTKNTEYELEFKE